MREMKDQMTVMAERIKEHQLKRDANKGVLEKARVEGMNVGGEASYISKVTSKVRIPLLKNCRSCQEKEQTAQCMYDRNYLRT